MAKASFLTKHAGESTIECKTTLLLFLLRENRVQNKGVEHEKRSGLVEHRTLNHVKKRTEKLSDATGVQNTHNNVRGIAVIVCWAV